MTILRRGGVPSAWLLGLLLICYTVCTSALERWFYVTENLSEDENVTNVVALMQRAALAGYTHMLINDARFCRLATMDADYFNNVNLIKQAANSLNLEIVPAVFPIGYSNDLLFNDPNLIEALPVTNALLVVSNGFAVIQPDPPVAFPGGDFSDLSLWSWKDDTVVADNGTARVTDPNGANARIVQQLMVTPFRQYHISVQIKTTNCVVAPQVLVLGGDDLVLNYNDLGVQPTQEWTTHHVVFNSLTNTTVSVYFGVWGGTTGTLWWDNAVIEEVAFLNLVRRPGAPLSITVEGGAPLVEGMDFATLTDPLMGTVPNPGVYDVYHTPPQLQIFSTGLPDGTLPPGLTNGTRLRASWSHAVTVNHDQANICVSEPATLDILRDQAQRMQWTWGTRGYFMWLDEIRVFNWCPACQARQMDAGAMLADNVQTCASILRQVNPGGRIYVWSDMFDPYHNAHANYYLARGNFANSWTGLDSDIIVANWNYYQRAASLQFFANLGNRQLIAGYYDSAPRLVINWLNAAQPYSGICGVMYTTWQDNYSDLETFEQLVANYPAPSLWLAPRLLSFLDGGQARLVLEGERGRNYVVEQSQDFVNWSTWINVTADDATLTFAPDAINGTVQFYRAACVQ
jgi:hypothetical protein